MAVKYMTLLTQVGTAKLANATALGKMLNITHMGVGDGGGNPTTPNPTQTALINEKRRAVLNALRVDPANPNQIIAEQVIPENEGGFWLREIGLYDADGDLIAVANCPDTYKPQLQEGSGRVQTVRMILVVSNASAVTLKVDPAVVLATRKSVDDKAIEVQAYADGLMTSHVNDANPHKQYAPIASPALTGVPTAPTVNSGNNSSQLATTAFVHNALADNAFALDFTSRAKGWDVPWDAKSGFYEAYLGAYSEAVLHFHGSASSCTALQFAAQFGNRGLRYRTSRDDKGFEHDWEQIYTTGFRPSPADIGALSVAEFNQSIKSYAPIESPALTGNPTAPTPPLFDADNSIATTAFVQRALGNMRSVFGVRENQVLTGDAFGCFVEAQVAGITITLPNASLCAGGVIEFNNISNGTVTISGAGVEILGPNNPSGSSTMMVKSGTNIKFLSTGPQWRAIGGGGAGIGFNGYQILPSGIIIQWGVGATLGAGVINQLFPIAYPNNIFSVVITENDSAGWNHNDVTVYGQSNSTKEMLKGYGAFVRNGGSVEFSSGISYKFIAIGN
ncbi:phage tail protein [Dickeya sp. CFBP 2040]|uniref:phage tail protein n=1 Tax=Dickeya sp. CFBP 2040 TaxID=2718531 RepID=UPI001448951D|nr:phage tail protein [Dickeya sp. CFBP 2040]NKI74760.1 phage tail protein [Dickeya sp. CFBP 2040]